MRRAFPPHAIHTLKYYIRTHTRTNPSSMMQMKNKKIVLLFYFLHKRVRKNVIGMNSKVGEYIQLSNINVLFKLILLFSKILPDLFHLF